MCAIWCQYAKGVIEKLTSKQAAKKLKEYVELEVFNNEWTLPVVQIYFDSKLSPRLSIGGNKRQKSYLFILDIRALDKGGQIDLTDWVEETINDGFDFYEYSTNSSQPTVVNKARNGYVSLDFISNLPLKLGDNVETFDKYRQNITISVTITQ